MKLDSLRVHFTASQYTCRFGLNRFSLGFSVAALYVNGINWRKRENPFLSSSQYQAQLVVFDYSKGKLRRKASQHRKELKKFSRSSVDPYLSYMPSCRETTCTHVLPYNTFLYLLWRENICKLAVSRMCSRFNINRFSLTFYCSRTRRVRESPEVWKICTRTITFTIFKTTSVILNLSGVMCITISNFYS